MSAGKKICFVGSDINKKKSDTSTVKLLIDAAKRHGVKLTNIPKGKYALLLGERVEILSDVDISSQDIFFFRDVTGLVEPITKERTRIFPEMITLAKHIKNDLGKRVFDYYLTTSDPEFNKVKINYKLAQNGIPVIPTWVFMKKEVLKANYDKLPFPIIIKPASGARGKGIFKFNNSQEMDEFLEKEFKASIFYPNLVQGYVPNKGDFRVLVLNGEVITAVRKIRDADSVVSNMSQGNEAELFDPDKEVAEIAIKAAQTVGMEFAGVDIIEDQETGKRYVLEVNLSPQIYYTTKFSKFNVADRLIEYFINS